ncbi:GTP pyrophosphokinase, (p)ppGpp synthetase I [Enterobacter asburiae]|uniref:GTP pyrophosphokinase n=1 Tax=Enterobacter asburiae TaxID=61645 RepID=A0A376FE43_ENTAS|nr:GTP pyrophosphokinase, (p)ppGpp synthetase I [Enterobacter asburiae]
MKEENVRAEVYGRPKHIYSIWRKMQKKHLAFDELFDVRAVRIVAERLQDCYAALGIVHTHFRHLPDEFDDYVANPKPNGYQSIHTVVLGPGGKTVEIQIRTKQMHEDAELGVAAHWKYKEGTSGGARSGHEDRIAWLRKLIAWQEEMADSGEMLDEVRSQVFDDRVYVFTPKGDVVDLPAGSTPLDFAYHIHSDVGHRCIGAKIGGRIVPFTYQLQMGDQIEIITQKQPNPSRDWLNPNLGYVTTSRGRSKIHAWFRKQDRDKNILAGRQILDDELEHIGISLKEAEKFLLPRYNFNELDELLAAIGGGDIRLNQMVNFLQAQFNKPSAAEQDAAALKQLQQKTYAPAAAQQRQRPRGGRGRGQSDAPYCPLLPAYSGRRYRRLYHPGARDFHSPFRLRPACRAAVACAGAYRRSGLGWRAIPPATRWWCASLPTTAAACCATSRPFSPTRRSTCWASPAAAIPASSLPPSI